MSRALRFASHAYSQPQFQSDAVSATENRTPAKLYQILFMLYIPKMIVPCAATSLPDSVSSGRIRAKPWDDMVALPADGLTCLRQACATTATGARRHRWTK